MEHESEGDTECNWGAWYNPQRIGTESEGLVNKRTCEDHSNYNIVEIVYYAENIPGDLRRLAVTQTPVKNHQFTLVWKILNKYNNNNNNLLNHQVS